VNESFLDPGKERVKVQRKAVATFVSGRSSRSGCDNITGTRWRRYIERGGS